MIPLNWIQAPGRHDMSPLGIGRERNKSVGATDLVARR